MIRPEWSSAVVCVGTFDGVHLGHQAVIKTAVMEARTLGLPAILVTFDRHPAAILSPEKCPPSLAGMEQNLLQIRALGVGITVVMAFDLDFSQKSATNFLALLRSSIQATRLVVGHDFAMGCGREGNTTWLQKEIPTTVVPAYEIASKRVSSSEIRSLIQAGNVEQAAKFLGRPFSIDGVVVEGQKLGRQLGYPTANLARSIHQILPKDGVYAAFFNGPKGRWKAALSIGTRPAVQGTTRTIEAYLLDYPGDSLYGLPASLEIYHFLREEQNFPSLEALTEQISVDVESVRNLLTSSV